MQQAGASGSPAMAEMMAGMDMTPEKVRLAGCGGAASLDASLELPLHRTWGHPWLACPPVACHAPVHLSCPCCLARVPAPIRCTAVAPLSHASSS